MHPSRIVLLVLLFRLNSSVWRYGNQAVEGDGETDHGHRLTARHMTDHMQTGGDQDNLNQRMAILMQFFDANVDEMVQVYDEREGFVSPSGWTRSPGLESQVTIEILEDVEHRVFGLVPEEEYNGQQRRMLVSFKREGINWFITHCGPFGRRKLNRFDEAINVPIRQMRVELENALNDASPLVHDQLRRGGADHQGVRGFNQAIAQINRLPGIQQIAAQAAPQPAPPPPYQVVFNLPPPRRLLLGLRRFDVQAICQQITEAGNALRPPPPPPPAQQRRWGEPDANEPDPLLVHLRGEGRGQQRGPGLRKRRSTDPTKTLSAMVQLTDADPESDFKITKIEFKERYGDEEETHVVDLVRKVLIEDPSDSGSKLTAEFEEANRVVTYKIVLRPSGN